jgi:hypothetical protein
MAKAKEKKSKTYEAKVKILATPFADMKAGQRMAIGTPELIRKLVAKIPNLRQQLAKDLGAEVACPVTTSMYLRIAVEEAFHSVPTESLVKDFPFWRAIDPASPLFKKLDATVQDFILKMQNQDKRGGSTAA